MKNLLLFATLLIAAVACNRPKEQKSVTTTPDSLSYPKGTFGYDLDFIQKNEQVILLGSPHGPANVLVVRDYQGRVMTSTSKGKSGTSYGWINYSVIESDSLLPHMNPFGGEDRIWVGPEGGQYSVFFKKGAPFVFAQWQTPAAFDSEPFDLVSRDSMQATFRKKTVLTNYSGFQFPIEVNRQIKLWTDADIEREFGISVHGLQAVAFESSNSITNAGSTPWRKNSGLLSIWILGMFIPSDHTTIVLPYDQSPDFEKKVTDNYFGAIPSDRIQKTEDRLFLKADGKYRGKVGIAPSIARNIAGSYDDAKHVLTLVKFDIDRKGDYVNSKWEIQKDPYGGDAVNSYNDGPLATGGQLGPFYELESSSPARELKPGDQVTHRHITLHVEGDEKQLNEIAMKLLGTSLADLRKAF